MDNTQVNELIVYFVITLFGLVIILFSLFYIFNSRRLRFIIEKKETREKFSKELETSRIESQEHLLKTLSWELHDNIGQLLSVSKVQLAMLSAELSPQDAKIIADTKELLSKILEDVRVLSKSLNAESFMFLGLCKAVSLEIERLNRLGFVHADFTIKGEMPVISNEHEVILFRIIQECISNVIKHARATEFSVTFEVSEKNVTIQCKDNGVGMISAPSSYGLGMKNILSRGNMLGAEVRWFSPEGSGLVTFIDYPLST